MAMNSSVIEKFTESFVKSEYVLEAVGSIGLCEEALVQYALSKTNNTVMATEGTSSGDQDTPPLHYPIASIVAPPTATDGQKAALTELANKFNVKFIVAIPRNVLDELVDR